MLWHLNQIKTFSAMYVSSVDLLFDFTKQDLGMVGGYMEDLKKTTNFQKLGVGHLPRDGRFPGTLLYLCENLGVEERESVLCFTGHALWSVLTS